VLTKTKEQPFDAALVGLAEEAKALAHPARLAILRFLAAQDTCICGEIVEALPLAQATVSRHLKVLLEAGLIQVTRKGTRSCYCVAPDAVGELNHRLGCFLDDVEEGGRSASC